MDVAQLLLFVKEPEQALEYVYKATKLTDHGIERLLLHLPKEVTYIQRYLLYKKAYTWYYSLVEALTNNRDSSSRLLKKIVKIIDDENEDIEFTNLKNCTILSDQSKVNKLPSLVTLASKALATKLASSGYSAVKTVLERVAMDRNMLNELMFDLFLETIPNTDVLLCLVSYFVKKGDYFRAYNASLTYKQSYEHNHLISIACYLGLLRSYIRCVIYRSVLS